MRSRQVILLRVAEIFLKGQNRNVFFSQFIRNARRLLHDLDEVGVEPLYLRALVHHPPEARDACLRRLGRLFGLASMSPATPVARDIDAFASEAIAQARAFPSGSTFKIETRRRDKRFPARSHEVSAEVGARVLAATDLRVDVHQRDQVVHIEIGPEQSFVYSAVLAGPGGLPVGTTGPVTLLLSGGIDSPVAGWFALRRGCLLSAVYFHSFPYTGNKTKEKVLELARKLGAWQGNLVVDVVAFAEVQKTLRDHGRAEYAVLLYRRMMVRVASLLAARRGARALVTGDNLGQVASQTLENLAVVENAARLPLLRPLLTFDKADIVAKAREIGTYETSILPYDDCCSLFVDKHPATRARIGDLRAQEEGLDVAALAAALADGAERCDVAP